MATKITEVANIPYRSPGVYFRDVDMTVVTQQTGQFSAAAIGLMERGPAFDISISNTYTERAFKSGELNPKFPTSYYAKQYLEQADNYKEVRLLGLEGYKDSIGFAIASAYNGSSPADPLIDKGITIGKSQLLAVLKLRPTHLTGLPPVVGVSLQKVNAVNPMTGTTMNMSNDYIFKLIISFDESEGVFDDMEVVCSLRPDSKDFIERKFGKEPLDQVRIGSDIAPLWVDFVIPSREQMPYNFTTKTFYPKGYYVPGTNVLMPGFIELVEGDIKFSTITTLNSTEILDITVSAVKTTVTVAGTASGLLNGDGVMLSGIKDSTYSNLTLLNNSFKVNGVTVLGGNTQFDLYDLYNETAITTEFFGMMPGSMMQPAKISITNSTDTFDYIIEDISFLPTSTIVYVQGSIDPSIIAEDDIEFSDVDGNIDEVLDLNTGAYRVKSVTPGTTTAIEIEMFDGEPLEIPNGVFYKTEPTSSKYIIPTWETELLNFEDVIFQTPITPWFVSDIDSSGDYKRLFKFWSISDGESANFEKKIEIANINPSGNNGKGTFDVVIRQFSDREDVQQNRLESFRNLTMDPTSDNYILRRIGDGEEFPHRSRFIIVEMNFDEQLEDNLLPYGCLGYPNVTGQLIDEFPWTVDYDKSKQINRQTLGLANNLLNSRKRLDVDFLSYKNNSTIFGKGFHLNPRALALGSNGELVTPLPNNTELNNTFIFASPNIFLDIKGRAVISSERKNRSKFVVAFYGGFDGWNVYSERTWGDPSSKDFEALRMATEILSDKELLDTDFTVLTTPDLNIEEHSAGVAAVLDMVRQRNDCLYIPDFKYDKDADEQSAIDILTSSDFRTADVAMYYPHLQISDPINKINSWMPPSILALGTIAYTATNEQVWQPPGGYIRTVTDNLVRSRKRLKIDSREALLTANINPITSFAGTGYEICGVRTTQEQFSALSFIHNKLLLCYAKKALNQTLRAMLFTMNSDKAKDQFIATVTPIFDRIKKLNGVEEYKVSTVERPELNDRTTLYGVIEIVPLYPIERIIVDFILQDGELTFAE